jgi:hypothetical protein
MRNKRTIELVVATFVALVTTGFGHGKPAVERLPVVQMTDRAALVIANAAYPDADAELPVVEEGVRIAASLEKRGYDVSIVRDATRERLSGAVEELKKKVRPGSSVVIWFGGYAVQAKDQNYLLPVDVRIWRERDIRTDGLAVDEVRSSLEQSGARERVLIVDGSRRNPYERRFRNYSHGLAPMRSGHGDEVIASALPPNEVIEDAAENKVGAFASALLNELDQAPNGQANRVLDAVTRTIGVTAATRSADPGSLSPDNSEPPQSSALETLSD